MRLVDASIEERNGLILNMAERGVACNVHFKPLPMLTAYRNMGFDIKDYPNSWDYFHNEVTLPSFSRMTDDQVEYVCQALLEVLQ